MFCRNARLKPPMNGSAGGERQAVGDDRVDHRDQRRDREAGHDGVADVLLAHHAAVEQAEARDGHHQHERDGGQHPGGVAARGRAVRQTAGTAGTAAYLSVASIAATAAAQAGVGGGAGLAAGAGSGRRGGGRRGGRVVRPRRGGSGEPDQRGDRQRRREASEKPRQFHCSRLRLKWDGAALTARPCPFRRCECARPIRARRRRSCRRRSGRCAPRRRSRRSLCRRVRR